MITISLNFKGYWRELRKDSVLSQSGIYCVYASTYNQTEKTFSLRELIYIGESDNVHERLSNHEKLPDWKRQLKAGETLCYSVASVESTDLVRAEAAMIYHHKPPCNTEYKYSFPYSDIVIQTSGENAKLDTIFAVHRTI